MIKLDIQEYCGSCCDFEPDVTKPFKQLHRLSGSDEVAPIQSDTIVRCEHAKRCESIRRYLKQQLINEVKEESKE